MEINYGNFTRISHLTYEDMTLFHPPERAIRNLVIIVHDSCRCEKMDLFSCPILKPLKRFGYAPLNPYLRIL